LPYKIILLYNFTLYNVAAKIGLQIILTTDSCEIQVSLGTSEFEYETEENLKWEKFNAEVFDLESLKTEP
jgi:hypothetical protein